MIKSLVIALSLVSLSLAQSVDPEIQVEAVQQNFINAGIVPSLLQTFDPSAAMNVSFAGVGAITAGQPLSETQVKSMPTVAITPANSSVHLGNNFTLVMVDAGPVGTDESAGQTRHWLTYGVTLTGSSAPQNVSVSTGTAITEYAGPAPDSGSGAHRYTILLYNQPSTFSPPANMTKPNIGVGVFNLDDFVTSSGLGSIVAGMYFTVEVGTATFTPSATSGVITSTIHIPSGTSSASSSSSSVSTNKNAALQMTSGNAYLFSLLFGLAAFF